MTLAWPWALAALPLPLLARWVLAPAAPLDGRALRLPAGDADALLVSGPPRPARGARLAGVLVWLLLVSAAARPQWLDAPVPLPVAGRDLMLVLDISGSMERTDYALDGRRATRLAVVKRTASEFIARRAQDRIGLILFGTRPYVQTPLTYDLGAVEQMLQTAVVGLAGRDTAIGDAIGLAVKRLRAQPRDNRVLVLLTDGANSAGALAPLEAARLAAQSGIRLYAIGLGDPVADAGREPPLDSAAVELDARTLRAIAAETAGRYFEAADQRALARVYAALDRLEPTPRAYRVYHPSTELFPWPAGAALCIGGAWLLLAALLDPDREAPDGETLDPQSP